MDDLDEALSRLAASTRTHADESIDIDAALASTLTRSADKAEVVELTDRRSPRGWYVAGAAALVGVLLVGVWALVGDRGEDRLVPVSPVEPVTTQPSEPVPTQTDPASDPATTAPAVPVSPEPSAASTIDESPEARPEAGSCSAGGSIEQVAADFYEAMLIARTLDDLDPVRDCLNTVPAVFDAVAPNCWGTCDASTRSFLPETFAVYQLFSVDGSTQWGSSVSVSYTTTDGDYFDVTETWSISPTPDGFTVEDFAIEEQSFLTREESAATIATYFEHIAIGDWQAAASMLNDGAQNLDERTDLLQLEPATFTVPDIAAALQDWCRLGCNTQRPTQEELIFDGLYGIERDGQSVRAAWFEGDYSISGLPIRTRDSLAADFDADAILADDFVTNDEYRTMFAFLSQCAADAGAPSAIPIPDFDELDRRFYYSIPGDSGEIFDSCYETHGVDIDIAFQVDPTREEQRIANYSRVARCIDAAGIDYRSLAQQEPEDLPADFPRIDVDELSIDELIQYAMLNAFADQLDDVATITACTTLGTQLITPITTSETSEEPPSSGAGRLIDVDEMAQATEQLQLPDTVPDLSLALDDGISLVVELAYAPGPVAEMVCVNNYVDDASTGRTCGDPTEIGGLLTFGLFEGKAAVLSNIDQPIEFEASSCREQWIAEAAPFKLQVCDTAGEFATVNGRDADGRPAHIELWGG